MGSTICGKNQGAKKNLRPTLMDSLEKSAFYICVFSRKIIFTPLKANPDPHSKVVDALTSVKSVNKTDAMTLINVFGSLEKIVNASIEDLTLCPGFGPHKAQKLHKVLHQTFKR